MDCRRCAADINSGGFPMYNCFGSTNWLIIVIVLILLFGGCGTGCNTGCGCV